MGFYALIKQHMINCLHLNIHYKQKKTQKEVWKNQRKQKPTCFQQIMFISATGSSCGCHRNQQQHKKHPHTHSKSVCHLKAKRFLAVVLSWHTVYGKASTILTSYPCCTQTKESKPTVLSIKVHVRAGVLLTAQGFLQSADLHGCSVCRESHIVEVRYRQG